jgi:hypothetical protein
MVNLRNNILPTATPFAPLPLQELHYYYEVVRHLAEHRYSASPVVPGLCLSLVFLHFCKTSLVP